MFKILEAAKKDYYNRFKRLDKKGIKANIKRNSLAKIKIGTNS